MGKAFDPFELNLTDDEEDQDLVAQPTIQSTTPAPDPEPAAGVRASGGFDPFAIDLEDEPEADRGLGSVFGAGVKSGVENYQETYELSRAWGNKITGDDEEAVEWYEKSQEHSKKAEAASAGIVTDFRDIGSWGDLGEYAAFTIGNLVPSMAESVVAGLAGAAIGTAAAPGIGTIGGGAVGAIAKGAAKKKLAQYAAANIAKGMAEDVAEAAAKKAVQAEIGGGVAMFFSSAQQGLGEVYGETVDEKTKLGNAEAALVGAPFFALADIVTEVGVLGRLTKDNGGEAVVKRFLKNFVVDTQKEGFAEVAQEGVTVLAGLASGKTYTSDDLIGRFGNSYFGGALGGGAMSAGGGVASAMRKRREASPIERTLDEHSDPETGLISLKALPRALVERIYEERPDAVREGGLFSAPKIHRGVIDDMHKQDAGQIEPEPEKDLDHDVERLMAAQNAEELDAVVQEMLAEPAPAAPQQEQTAQATEQVPQNLTRRGDGNPFSTAAAANAYAQSQGFGGYSVVEDGAGYALVRGDTAPAPAGPEDAARAAMAEAVSDPAPAPAPAADIAPDQEYIPLTHWGKNAGMQQLDPEFHGTAAAGGETSRAGKDFLPRTYYGMPGYKAEPVVLANAKARYFTKVKKSDLYDIENDPLNLRDIAKRRVAAASASSQVAFGGWSIQPPVDSGEIITQYENEIRKAGFKGYFSAATKTVAMFEAAPVVEITTNPSEQVGYAGWDEMGSVNPPSGKVTPMPVQDEAGAAQEPATASAGTTTSPTAETPQKGSEQPSGGADKKADKKNVEKAKFDEFRSFFSNVTKGAEQHSDVPFVPDLVDIDREVVEVKEAHSGNFDDHIKKSIPTFYEAQIATIKALGKVLKKGAVVLDIAASEGSWGKALTQLSGVKTVSLDPNPDMAAFFEKKSQVPGATYSTEAFGGSWVEDDGTEVKQHNPAKKYDAIHESMGFQFISPDRAGQIAEVRRLLAPGGILLTEQKLKGANWKANEEFKDKNHKSKYFDAAMLAKKDAIVGFSGKKELTQSEHDAVTTGMVSNQVEQSEMEKILSERFAYVAQYWDSGNFKGYIATDSKDRFDAFLAAIPNLDSPYSGGPSVRVIQGKPSAVSRLQPGKLQDLTKQNDWAMLTAENAMGKQMPAEQNALRMKLLKEDLTRLGLDFADVKGKYGQLENSVFVSGITREQALKLSKKYQQDSVLMSEGLVYHDGRVDKATGTITEFEPTEKDDFYSTVPATGVSFRVDIDFGQDSDVTDVDGIRTDVVKSGVQPLGMTETRAEAIVSGLASKFQIFRNGFLSYVVVQTPQDLPKDVQERMNKRGVLHRVRAAYDPATGIVHFVARNFSDKSDLTKTFLHEVAGHAGLRYVFGSALDAVLKQVIASHGALVKRLRQEYGLTKHERGEMIAAEEALTELSETNPKLGIVQRAIAVMRNALRAMGINAALSDNDMLYIMQVTGEAAKGSRAKRALRLRKLYAGDDSGAATADVVTKLAEEPAKVNDRQASPGAKLQKDFSPHGNSRVSQGHAILKTSPINSNQQEITASLESMRADPAMFKKNMDVVRNFKLFAKGEVDGMTDDQVARRFIEHVRDNLVWLANKFEEQHPGMRERAKLWYIGANKIAGALSKKYRITTEQAAAVLATQSPQKDWFQNISLAERIIAIHKDKQAQDYTERMAELETKVFESKPEHQALLNAIKGKRLGDLDTLLERAAWVRLYDEAENSYAYASVTPEGDVVGVQTRKDGVPQTVAWQGFGTIAKSLSILDDGSFENISNMLGGEHKVRNFYNNIVAPNALGGDVTIDTHAVAAAWLMPMSASAIEVGQNFGTSGKPIKPQKGASKKSWDSYKRKMDRWNSETDFGRLTTSSSGKHGFSGLYGLYADAYREAAAQAGLLPREMQSITWEAVRGLFEKTQKGGNKSLDGDVQGAWGAFHESTDGDINATREAVLQLAGGIAAPIWSRGSAGRGVPGQGEFASYGTELLEPDLRRPGKPVRGGADGAARVVEEEALADEPSFSVADNLADWHANQAQDQETIERNRRKRENVEAWVAGLDGVEVYDTPADFPFAVEPGVRAAAWRGRVYIAASEFASKAEVRDAYAHEMVGHLKAEQVEGYFPLLSDVMDDASRVGVVKQVWDAEQAKRPWAGKEELARETIAVMAERGSKHPLIRRLVNAYRKLLRTLGAIDPTEAKIYSLIERAYREKNVTNDNQAWFSVANKLSYQAQMRFVDDTLAMGIAEDDMGADGQKVRREIKLERSRVVYEVEDLLDTYVQPMEAARARAGFATEQVSKFLHARHAIEANASLRRRNIARMIKEGALPSNVDPERIPLSQVQPLIQGPKAAYWNELWEAPAGMTDQDAADILREFSGDPDMQQIGNLADQLSEHKLSLMVSSGLLSQVKADVFRNAYKHYVPLFRDLGEQAPVDVGLSTRKSGRQGSPGRVRKGSTKSVLNVYAQLINEAQRTVMTASKQKVFTQFLGEVRAHPGNGLFQINETKETVTLDAAGNIVTRDTLIQDPNLVISGYENGKRVNIVASDDPVARNAVGVWNRIGYRDLNFFSARVAMLGRFFSKMYTSMSINFLVANPARDLMTAMANVKGEEIGGAVSGRAKILGNWMTAFTQILASELGYKNTRFGRVFEEMGRTGGRMAWLEVFPDEADKSLVAIQRKYGHKYVVGNQGIKRMVGSAAGSVWAGIEYPFKLIGTATENATRAVVWDAAVKAGLDKGLGIEEAEKSASKLSREVTADFLSHGTMSQSLNAWYLFFNPAVQGTAKAIRRLREAPGSTLAIYGGLIMTSFMIDQMARELSDDDDEDGISNYDEASVTRTKDRNLVMPVPKEVYTTKEGRQAYITLPVAYYFNAFTVMGQALSEAFSGAKMPEAGPEEIRNSAFRSAQRVINTAFQSLSPFGGFEGGATQFAAPTIGDLFVQVASNQDAFGNPIHPEAMGFWDTRQQHELSFKKTPEFYKTAGKFVHHMLGGDEHQARFANALGIEALTNPEVLQHLAHTFGGGPVALVESTMKAVGEDGSPNNIVGLSRFFKAPQTDTDFNSKWYPVSDMMGEHTRRIEELDGVDLARFLSKNPEARLAAEFKELESSVKKLKGMAKKGTPEQAQAVEDRIYELQMEFLRKYNQATE